MRIMRGMTVAGWRIRTRRLKRFYFAEEEGCEEEGEIGEEALPETDSP